MMFDDGEQKIASVTPGMRVVDSTGEDIGEVEAVKMGDPGAVTSEGQQAGEPFDLVDAAIDAVVGSEPRVPHQLAERLLRLGYIKVDAKGLLGTDRYAASDQVAEVSGDTVRLNVTGDQLTESQGIGNAG